MSGIRLSSRLSFRPSLPRLSHKGPRQTPYRFEPGNPRSGSATLLRPCCRNCPWWCRTPGERMILSLRFSRGVRGTPRTLQKLERSASHPALSLVNPIPGPSRKRADPAPAPPPPPQLPDPERPSVRGGVGGGEGGGHRRLAELQTAFDCVVFCFCPLSLRSAKP
jgi:hypothetical protein